MRLRGIKRVSFILGSTVMLSALVFSGCGKKKQKENATTKESVTTVTSKEDKEKKTTKSSDTSQKDKENTSEAETSSGEESNSETTTQLTQQETQTEHTQANTFQEAGGAQTGTQQSDGGQTSNQQLDSQQTSSSQSENGQAGSQQESSSQQTGNGQAGNQQTGTQQPVTSAPVTPEANKYIVNYVTEQGAEQRVAYKYGVVKIVSTTNRYAVYNDGSKVLMNSYSSEKYDSSGYQATNDELRAESDSNASSYRAYYEEVLRLVNNIRAEAGVAPLVLDDTLCRAASMRAVELDYSNQFSHTRPDGSSCFSIYPYFNISYSATGENIAAGQPTPAAVVEGWKNSSGHYANMINASYGKLGVGYSASGVGDYGVYWVQMFTN